MKTFFWKDKSGRGASGTHTSKGIRSSTDEQNYDGDSLHEWVKDCEEGDEFENSTDKWVCTSVKEDDPPKKIPAGTLDLEPTWESLYIGMLEMHVGFMNYTFKKYTPRIRTQHELLLSQFKTMARAADAARQRQKEINSRIILVDDQRTTIGEFIKANTDDDGTIAMADEEYEMITDMRPGEMITIGGGAAAEFIITRQH